MQRHHAMAGLHQLEDAEEILRTAHVGGGEGLGFDEIEDQRARFEIDDIGREAAFGRGAAGRELVEAHHLVDRDVVTDAHEVFLALVLDQEIGVGDSALILTGTTGSSQHFSRRTKSSAACTIAPLPRPFLSGTMPWPPFPGNIISSLNVDLLWIW